MPYPLKISFDLDDTLIATGNFETEKQSLIQRLMGIEKIRVGTIGLFKSLRENGHSICIYTTSYRSKSKIKFLFFSYGIGVDAIINQDIHNKNVTRRGITASKYPPAFGIDLHIDDSYGVEIEGTRFGFKTIIINLHDNAWVQKVLKTIESTEF